LYIKEILGKNMADEAQQELAILPAKMEYQGVWIRFLSLLIDSIIISIISFMIWIMFGFGIIMLGTIPWHWGLMNFIIYAAYFTVLEGYNNGQTIGKMIARIGVVREEDGRKIDMERSFKRNILRIIDGLIAYLVGAVLIWRSDKKQRLGDSIAKTVVIKV
jgi:uncharacterized RDD family membrane protein YckC